MRPSWTLRKSFIRGAALCHETQPPNLGDPVADLSNEGFNWGSVTPIHCVLGVSNRLIQSE